MMEKVIICAAVNGNRGQDMGVKVPITPDEIGDEALRCFEAGASIVHFHARDKQTGDAILDMSLFSETIHAIRARCKAIVETTTGSGPKVDPVTRQVVIDPITGLRLMPSDDERLMILDIDPPQEMSNIAVGSLNAYLRGSRLDGVIYTNSPYYCRTSAKKLSNKLNSVFQFEIFDFGFLYNVKRLVEEGYMNLANNNYWFNFCLGYGGSPATPRFLANLVNEMQGMFEGRPWGVTAEEVAHYPMARSAVNMGENIRRTGYEDCVLLPDGSSPRSNAELVAEMVKIIQSSGREVASVDEARAFLGLQHK